MLSIHYWLIGLAACRHRLFCCLLSAVCCLLSAVYPAVLHIQVQRLCSVLDTVLSTRTYLIGEEYTIADMAALPWFQMLRTDRGYQHQPSGVRAREFLRVAQYKHLNRWADLLMQRPAVQRGMLVCRKYGKPWLEDERFKHLSKL